MAESSPRRLLLRAEIVTSDFTLIGHTLEISEQSIFVRTDETVHIGDRMTVRLSFPGALDPLELHGHVVSQTVAAEPGEPRGLTVALMFRNDEQREALRALLAEELEVARRDGPYRILYVEDATVVREVFAFAMQKFFRRRGREVAIDFAESVDSAWDLAIARGPYDLVLVDYYLPRKLGEALIQQLRRHPTLRTMPIIAVSVGGEVARRATLEAGADLFLDKPLQLSDLFATIDQLTLA